jgi:MoxR-like ATPase
MATRSVSLVAPVAPVALNGLATLRAVLVSRFVDRADAIDALIAALVSGEHILFLGPPGSAKSALATAVAQAIGLRSWRMLLTRFSEPSEVFGPVKMSAYKADRYERATARTFVEAEIAFIDECFKANSAILNALLTALNERIFDNGGTVMDLPLVTCMGASNEGPEGPELAPFYDRFMFRVYVPYVADRGSFVDLLTRRAAARTCPLPPIAPIAGFDLRAEQTAARAVTIGSDVVEAMADLRSSVDKAKIAISDRRWCQSLDIAGVAAHIDGRTVATPEDLAILESCLWHDADQRTTISRLVQGTVNPDGARAVEILDAVKATVKALPALSAGRAPYLAACGTAIDALTSAAEKLAKLSRGRKVDAAIAEVGRMHDATADASRDASRRRDL